MVDYGEVCVELTVKLKNCYGIGSLDYTFSFSENNQDTSKKAFAIYAPNGVMKSSFAKTFEAISNGEKPKEERFNKPSSAKITKNGNPIGEEEIYVLHGQSSFNTADTVSNILVSSKRKKEYDSLILDVEKSKKDIINQVFKKLGTRRIDAEQEILDVTGKNDFPSCIQHLNDLELIDEYSELPYQVIFHQKVLAIIKDKDFIERAEDYTKRYEALFDETGDFLAKGVFNPAKANTSINTLDRQDFFTAGHRVHIKGDKESIGKKDIKDRLAQINEKIGSDKILRKIRDALAGNVDVQAFNSLLEKLSSDKVQQLLEGIKPNNISRFRKNMLASIIQSMPEVEVYLSKYILSYEDINRIELEAKNLTPQWHAAVELFNLRFLNMPFTMSIQNPSLVVVGQEKARLQFTFLDESTQKSKTMKLSESGSISTLSDGEARALDLLYFIFEVEERKKNSKETVFVIDDIADSFDYKNKHAIIQYLRDLTTIPYFHLIVLTHNFDFFRALESNRIVSYPHCLMANKLGNTINLVHADGIRNYFANVIQEKINQSASYLLASIPFTRNIVEYTRGQNSEYYLQLTEMLHWKERSGSILLEEYCSIYNDVFSKKEEFNSFDLHEPLISFLEQEVAIVISRPVPLSLCLEDKILLSVAIRIIAEKKIIEIYRNIDSSFCWPNLEDCYGDMLGTLKRENRELPQLSILESVGVMVNSNIHLNSFMYEPIIDLTIDHLKKLYQDVNEMSTDIPALNNSEFI